ncbi:MAG: hypothetical protein PHR68_00145 [Candidatus Gracilibacteria bacterium]|nr:hypothetical protein [Candidatus Gracilibacteria bacterium]
MKKILIYIGFVITLALLKNNAFADSVIHESCSTGTYASSYGNSCDVCGYYDGALYKGESKDYWDYFLNDSQKEQILSSSSNGIITPLNGASLSSSGNIQLRTNWIPKTAGINGTKEVVAFYLENLLFSGIPTGTGNVIGKLQFNIKGAAVDNTNQTDSLSVAMPLLGWNYLKGNEVLLSNGTYRLDGTYINGPSGNLKIYSGSTYTHNECYIVRGAWCGDGKKDSQESCDPNDASKSGWGDLGCTSSCTPSNSTGGGGLPECGDGIKQGSELCDPKDSTKTGWGIYGCSSSCIPTNNTGGGGGGGGGSGGGSSCGNGVINPGEECDLGSANNSKYACNTSCKITVCGDGILQRPNGNAQFEECDFGSSTWPSWCSKSDCKITGDSTTPSEGGGDYTMPSDKDGIIFYPSGGAILGNNMKLFATYNLDRPYIKNNTGYDLYIEKPLCLYKENKSYLEGNLSICSSGNIGSLAAGAKFQINTNDYTANTDNVIGAFESVKLFTAPEGLQNSYLSSTLKVIVAKSSVGSISGGTSLLNYDPNYYSDVDTISKNFLTDLRNKNFIVTSISQNNGFSSYVNKIENTGVYNDSLTEWNNSSKSINQVYNFTYNSTGYTLPTENYNGISNVFTHKGDLVLNGQSIVGNKTYVIQDGNLYINGNIDLVSGNIAFIVKGGNIIISNSVTGLEGIYITIKENNIGGNINSDSIKTNNRLIINGGLYGNVKDLISNRTYMKSDNGIINVGTVINFKSAIFKNPPPLLTSFVEEYMKVNKIAK